MSTPGGPRKANPWPFLAISVLVLLLGTFLAIKFMKPEHAPSVVKEPPPPPEPISEPTPKEPPAEPVPKEPTVQERLAALVARIEKGVAEKKWDEATADLKAARALQVKDERLDILQKHAFNVC